MGVRDPWHCIVDCRHRPNQCAKHRNDIGGGQGVIFQAELDGSERCVCNEVENEGESHHCGNISQSECNEDGAEGNGNDRIEKGPDGSEYPRRWRPGGLFELGVALRGIHSHIIAPLRIRFRTREKRMTN